MASEVFDSDYLVEMFVSLYLNKYSSVLGDICLDVAECYYNRKTCPCLLHIVDIIELALDFQENVSHIIKKKKTKVKEQPLSISVPKQESFTFTSKTFIFGPDNFVTST